MSESPDSAALADRLRRRAERERVARQEAERLLEDKSRELWEANRRLAAQADGLEREVAERTEELRRALDRAEELSQAKSRFLAMMSHEIRTPLHGVLGVADMLGQSPLDPHQREYVDLIRSSGSHLLTLVNDILDLSKVEAGQLTLEVRTFDLHAELTTAVGSFATSAEQRGLELSLDLAPGVPQWVVGDSARLRQVLWNLVSNALKFTPEGGVRVRAWVPESGPNDPAPSPLTASVRLQVSDTGIGLPDHAGDFLFQPFGQADEGTSRVYGGTGLGLAIVRQLVELMGGTVAWSSAPGAGTTFTLTVPLRLTDPPVPVATPMSCESCLLPNRLRVLVVDDVEVNRLVASRQVERLGHEVDLAEGGLDGVRQATSRDYDVVLMDVRMPDLDGLSATRQIRAHESGHRAYVIALTAGAYAADEEACREAGMDAFLAKPFRIDDLRAMLCARCLVKDPDTTATHGSDA
ncbi:MAG: ATP-binding protein [Candidatus Nanopelagicales bacterium]